LETDLVKVILFGGISGSNKFACVSRLRDYLIKQHASDLQIENADVDPKSAIPIYEIPPPGISFLNSDWRNTLDAINKNLPKEFGKVKAHLKGARRIKLVFAHTHLTYFLQGTIRSWLSAIPFSEVITEPLELERIVVLTDNVFYHQHETTTKKTHISISDLSAWREAELLLADVLSSETKGLRGLDYKVDLISVHQPLQSLAEIVLNRKKRVYLAFPITEARRWQYDDEKRDPEKAQKYLSQNLVFRKKMSDHFLAFDPSAIDEVLYHHNDNAAFKEHPATISIAHEELWPWIVEPELTILGKKRDSVTVSTRELQDFLHQYSIRSVGYTDGIKDKKSEGYRAIHNRDFRLIDQSKAVIFFRPTVKGYWSNGVRQELEYAAKMFKTICIIMDEKDTPPFDRQTQPLARDFPHVFVVSKHLDDPQQLDAAINDAKNWVDENIASDQPVDGS
jgi:hypothetical protein